MKILSLLCLIGIAGFGVVGCEYYTVDGLKQAPIVQEEGVTATEAPMQAQAPAANEGTEDEVIAAPAPSAIESEPLGDDPVEEEAAQEEAEEENSEEGETTDANPVTDDIAPIFMAAYGLEDNRSIDLFFNESMDLTSTTNYSILIFNTTHGSVDGEFTYGETDHVLRFTAAQPFQKGLVYVLEMRGADSTGAHKAVTDLSGNEMQEQHKQKLQCNGLIPIGLNVIGCE